MKTAEKFYAQFPTDLLLVGRGGFAGERDVDVGVVLVGRGQEEVVRRHVAAEIERIDPFHSLWLLTYK